MIKDWGINVIKYEKKNIVISLFGDNEANVWLAINREIGIALESDSIENLIQSVKQAVPEMLFLNKISVKKPITLCFNILCKL